MQEFLIGWTVVFALCQFARKWWIWALVLLAAVVAAAVGWAIFGFARMPSIIFYGTLWGLATQAVVLLLGARVRW